MWIAAIGEEVMSEDEPGLEQERDADEDEGAREESSQRGPAESIDVHDLDDASLEGKPTNAEGADGEQRTADESRQGVPRQDVTIQRRHGHSLELSASEDRDQRSAREW
jgi:hypothetical protein